MLHAYTYILRRHIYTYKLAYMYIHIYYVDTLYVCTHIHRYISCVIVHIHTHRHLHVYVHINIHRNVIRTCIYRYT